MRVHPFRDSAPSTAARAIGTIADSGKGDTLLALISQRIHPDQHAIHAQELAADLAGEFLVVDGSFGLRAQVGEGPEERQEAAFLGGGPASCLAITAIEDRDAGATIARCTHGAVLSFVARKLEAGVGIEPAYTALQAAA